MRPSIIEIYKLGGYFFRLENSLKSSLKETSILSVYEILGFKQDE